MAKKRRREMLCSKLIYFFNKCSLRSKESKEKDKFNECCATDLIFKKNKQNTGIKVGLAK